jgi:hypothetical protein
LSFPIECGEHSIGFERLGEPFHFLCDVDEHGSRDVPDSRSNAPQAPAHIVEMVENLDK